MNLIWNDVSLVDTPCPPTPLETPQGSCKQTKKKGKTMYHVDNCISVEAQQKEYFIERATGVYREKYDEAMEFFNLALDTPPESPEDLIERIKTGKYVLTPRDQFKRKYDWSPLDRISWRDPNAKPDEEGFETFKKTLNKAQQKALDAVWASDAVGAAEAIQEFEAVTIQ